MIEFNSCFKTIINESPLYHQLDYSKELNDKKLNQLYCNTIKQLFKLIDNFQGLDVYVHEDHHINTWFFIRGNDVKATIKFLIDNDTFYSFGLWQGKLSKNLIWDIITKYIALNYSSIVSDNIMNQLGKNFWKKLLLFYYNRGKRITVIYDRKTEVDYAPRDFEKYFKSQIQTKTLEVPNLWVFKIYF